MKKRKIKAEVTELWILTKIKTSRWQHYASSKQQIRTERTPRRMGKSGNKHDSAMKHEIPPTDTHTRQKKARQLSTGSIWYEGLKKRKEKKRDVLRRREPQGIYEFTTQKTRRRATRRAKAERTRVEAPP